MGDDIISMAIMTISTVIITAALINAVLPTILSTAQSIHSSALGADERVRTSFAITNWEKKSSSEMVFDVLNTGETSLPPSRLQLTSVYQGPDNSPVSLIAYNESTSGIYWTYALTGEDDAWDAHETLLLRVCNPAGDFSEGSYRLRIALFNGATGEQSYTI